MRSRYEVDSVYITVGVTVHRALEGLQIVYLTFFCWHLALDPDISRGHFVSLDLRSTGRV